MKAFFVNYAECGLDVVRLLDDYCLHIISPTSSTCFENQALCGWFAYSNIDLQTYNWGTS